MKCLSTVLSLHDVKPLIGDVDISTVICYSYNAYENGFVSSQTGPGSIPVFVCFLIQYNNKLVVLFILVTSNSELMGHHQSKHPHFAVQKTKYDIVFH